MVMMIFAMFLELRRATTTMTSFQLCRFQWHGANGSNGSSVQKHVELAHESNYTYLIRIIFLPNYFKWYWFWTLNKGLFLFVQSNCCQSMFLPHGQKNQMHLAVRILFSGITQSTLLIGTRKLNPSIRSVGPTRCLAAYSVFCFGHWKNFDMCDHYWLTEEKFSKCFINL